MNWRAFVRRELEYMGLFSLGILEGLAIFAVVVMLFWVVAISWVVP